MFNTPILDITIGLVFIFLLYSLLATSVNEMIATALSLRGRMLKKGIIQGMLSDTPGYNRWQSIGMGIWEYICAFIWIFTGRPEKKYKKIGDKFYEHPMIKNYGENRVYSAPSYIKTGNFSTVLLEVLKQEFTDKLDAIAGYRFSRNNNRPSLVEIKQELINQPDIIKIKDLLEYYGSFYANASEPPSSVIDKDTWSILQLHLKNSIYSMEAFTKKVEGWFDDSMNRVSGWYKRQAQVILFLIGLVIAITFNVDVISITKKLSKDDKLREQLLQNAIAYSKQNPEGPAAAVYGDSNKIHDSAYLTEVQKKYRMVDSLLASDIKDVNALMALGWGDYGRSKDSAQVIKKCQAEFDLLLAEIKSDTALAKTLTVNQLRSRALKQLYDEHWIKLKIGFILSNAFKGVHFLGFVLLALGICLGAPFWFDLMNKLINLRGAGKQELPASGTGKTETAPGTQAPPAPVTINLNTQPGQEAAG